MMRSKLLFLWLALLSVAAGGQSVDLRISTPVEPPQKQRNQFVVPIGTRVVMQLLSPLDTESAVTESGVYLETLFPVIVDSQVAIPAHSYVQGTIAAEKRAGHLSRVAKFRMRFTDLVLADGYSMPIEGALLSLPGSGSTRGEDQRGSVARADQLDRALPGIGAGALVGAVLGSVRRFRIGTWTGAALGAGVATGAVLLTRGDSIHWPEGTRVEMVLNAPVKVPQGHFLNSQSHSLLGVQDPPANAVTKGTSDSKSERAQQSLGGLLTREVMRGILR